MRGYAESLFNRFVNLTDAEYYSLFLSRNAATKECDPPLFYVCLGLCLLDDNEWKRVRFTLMKRMLMNALASYEMLKDRVLPRSSSSASSSSSSSSSSPSPSSSPTSSAASPDTPPMPLFLVLRQSLLTFALLDHIGSLIRNPKSDAEQPLIHSSQFTSLSSSSSASALPNGLKHPSRSAPPITPAFVVSHYAIASPNSFIQSTLNLLRKHIDNSYNSKAPFESSILNTVNDIYLVVDSFSEYFDVLGMQNEVLLEHIDDNVVTDSTDDCDKWIKFIWSWFKKSN
jgi:hypothetical protein